MPLVFKGGHRRTVSAGIIEGTILCAGYFPSEAMVHREKYWAGYFSTEAMVHRERYWAGYFPTEAMDTKGPQGTVLGRVLPY